MEASGKASGAGPRAVVIPAVPGLFISASELFLLPAPAPGGTWGAKCWMC